MPTVALDLPTALALAATLLLPVVLLVLADHPLVRRLLCRPRLADLSDGVVVVTGGAGGLGLEIALAFLRQGATVVLWDVREDAMREAREWLCRATGLFEGGAPVALQRVDVADADAVAAAAERCMQTYGVPRVVVNNAALVVGHGVLDADAAGLRRSFDVNVLGHFWVARAFAPRMLASGRPGTLVTMGSAMASGPAARLADYCAAKAAVGQLHACLRCELALAARREPHGLTCLHVQPYLVGDTPLFHGGVPMRYALLRRLLPPLRAADVAARVVDAVRRGRESLVLPWIVGLVPPALLLLPTALGDLALGVAGAQTAMDSFRGRGESDWEQMGIKMGCRSRGGEEHAHRM